MGKPRVIINLVNGNRRQTFISGEATEANPEGSLTRIREERNHESSDSDSDTEYEDLPVIRPRNSLTIINGDRRETFTSNQSTLTTPEGDMRRIRVVNSSGPNNVVTIFQIDAPPGDRPTRPVPPPPSGPAADTHPMLVHPDQLPLHPPDQLQRHQDHPMVLHHPDQGPDHAPTYPAPMRNLELMLRCS